jgi:hypothetical protein
MTGSFTSAAMERIAKCVAVSAADAELTRPASLLTSAIEKMSPESVPDGIAADESSFELLAGFDLDQVISFSVLTELAVRASYVDLAEWTDAPLLESVVRRFYAMSAGWPKRPHSELMQSLLARFDGGELRRATRDDVAFSAFESYLHITRTVARDVRLLGAVTYLQHSWAPRADEAVLISPGNFADALVHQRVGEAQTQDVDGMIRLLRAIDWLMQISRRLSENDALWIGILAHARWSHAAWVVLMRADEWARSMSEWTQSRDRDGERRWIEFRRSVLLPLVNVQAELGLDTSTNEALEKPLDVSGTPGWRQQVPLQDVSSWVDALMHEGRDERARRVLHVALDSLSSRASSGDDDSRITALEQLVAHAQKLAALGDLRSSAAFVSPFTDYLVEKVGRQYGVTAEALELVARARRTVEPASLVEADAGIDARPLLYARDEPKEERYRALGEEA